MVGMVVAFLGATVLANFGASIFSVHLVAFSFMREFGVLLPAILIAGRTASAYTAQIGSMKANEEIDALRSNALDPIELLVLPRVLALLVSLPLLTLVGILAGIAGGATMRTELGNSSRTVPCHRAGKIEVRHFLVGMSKSPLFAVMIAAIGCHEGFKVAGSAESVGDTRRLCRAINLHGDPDRRHRCTVLHGDGLVSAVKQDTDNGVRHAIEVRGLDNRFGTQQVHQDLTWTCGAGKSLAWWEGQAPGNPCSCVASSGCRSRIRAWSVSGRDLLRAQWLARARMERRFGILFQKGALYHR